MLVCVCMRINYACCCMYVLVWGSACTVYVCAVCVLLDGVCVRYYCVVVVCVCVAYVCILLLTQCASIEILDSARLEKKIEKRHATRRRVY